MKIIKPQRLGLLYRVFQNGRENFLVVSSFLFFPLSSPRRLLSEASLWKTAAAELGEGVPLDAGMPKVRGEVIAVGTAHAGARATTALSVRIQVGSIDKSLYVIGDRAWSRSGHSEPRPFREMKVSWQHAFGGEGHAANPLGKGARAVRREGSSVHPLPNVEDPRHLVRSKEDRPAPAGFGPYDVAWPQRQSKLGTYDARWAKERSPGFAADLDMSFFNVAPEDQWLEQGYFAGDERYSIENMHPSGTIEGALPGLATRTFVTHRTSSGEAWKEIENRLDTVYLFPSADRCLVVSRGWMPIADDDAHDIVNLVIACEERAKPKPSAHYEEVLARRLDLAQAHLHVLRDADLLPWPDEGEVPADDAEFAAWTARENLTRANARRGLAAERAEASLSRAEASGDSESAHPATVPTDGPTKRFEASPSELPSGPPDYSAEAELERLTARVEVARRGGFRLEELEAQLVDPMFADRLRATEGKLVGAYRRSGHHQPPAGKRSDAESGVIRARIRQAASAKQSLAGWDLTGADLSALDLRGLDLSRALLECADLRGTKLDQAILDGAMLARTDLTDASLEGATLVEANLAASCLRRTRLDGCALARVVFEGATLVETSFVGARLSNLAFANAALDRVDLSRVVAHAVDMTKCAVSGSKLASSSFVKSNFIECDLRGNDFDGANLERANVVGSKLDGSTFVGAHLHRLRLVHGSSASRCDFRGSNLATANLRSADLSGSDFSSATIEAADFSESNLTGARFHRVKGKEARFIRSDCTGADFTGANLMMAILQKAILARATFLGANLFRADLALSIGDAATSFAEANVAQVRIVARGKS